MTDCKLDMAHLWMQANQFWRHPFRPVMGSRQLVEFVVLDVEPVGRATDRMVQADVQVRLAAPASLAVYIIRRSTISCQASSLCC